MKTIAPVTVIILLIFFKFCANDEIKQISSKQKLIDLTNQHEDKFVEFFARKSNNFTVRIKARDVLNEFVALPNLKPDYDMLTDQQRGAFDSSLINHLIETINTNNPQFFGKSIDSISSEKDSNITQ